MNPKRLLKRTFSRLFFFLLRRYGQDQSYRGEMARALAPILRDLAGADDHHDLWQEHGFHLLEHHFYRPIPDTRELPQKLWDEVSECAGIDFRGDAQLALMRDLFPQYMPECDFPTEPSDDPREFHLGSGAFEAVDAEVLHGFVRHFRPNRIIEVGSGYSTLVTARACQLNAQDGHRTRVTAIEPYPSEVLRNGLPGLDQLLVSKCQDVPLELFEELEDGDILFIDSTHVVQTGGDVNYVFFSILPRLKNGVLVHFHDIHLPGEYPSIYALEKHWFWAEQYLLQAFLMHNRDYEVLWAGNYMRVNHEDELAVCFPSYARGTTIPASLWLKKGMPG